MDANTVIGALVAIYCVLMLARMWQGAKRNRPYGWTFVLIFVLLLTALGYYFAIDSLAIISGVPFLILVVIPLAGNQIANRLYSQQRYDVAYQVMRITYLFHPLDGWSAFVATARALMLGQQGNFTEAFDVLRRYPNQNLQTIDYTNLELYRLSGEWEQMRAYLERKPGLGNDFRYIGYYMRALGETGDLNNLVAMYQRYRDKFGKDATLASVLLFVYAFAGRRAEVERLIATAFGPDRPAWKTFWLATADLAAGDQSRGQQGLDDVAATGDRLVQTALQRRRDYSLRRASDILTPESIAILNAAESDLVRLEQYVKQTIADRARPYVTYALIGINVAVFILEMYKGGADNPETLFNLGALMPLMVLAQNEWWRVLASMFLHFGILHLGMNMLGLYIIGPRVEKILGGVSYFIMYMLAGLGPGVLMVLAARYGLIDPQILAVGASGAIMGVLGAEGAIMLRGWRVNKSQIARQRLNSVVFLIVLESVFDLTVLSTGSLFAHLSGTVVGFIVASLLQHRGSSLTLPAD